MSSTSAGGGNKGTPDICEMASSFTNLDNITRDPKKQNEQKTLNSGVSMGQMSELRSSFTPATASDPWATASPQQVAPAVGLGYPAQPRQPGLAFGGAPIGFVGTAASNPFFDTPMQQPVYNTAGPTRQAAPAKDPFAF